MLKEDCRVGMKVVFGRENGEQTTGVVKKINRVRAKIEILEDRGSCSSAGALWTVSYIALEPVNNNSLPEPVVEEEIKPWLQNSIDRAILNAILCAYNGLSPEILHCDGEISAAQARQRAVTLNRKLKFLFQAYGKEVSEDQIYKYSNLVRADRR